MAASKECPELALGIGSVVDAPTAALYIQLGACFVVGPLFNPDIVPVCNRRLVPYCPGCGTVSEIGKAQELGCDLCKLFPGLTAWVKAGVYCVGMGSKLFPKEEVAAGNWQYITDKCKEALGYIAEARV